MTVRTFLSLERSLRTMTPAWAESEVARRAGIGPAEPLAIEARRRMILAAAARLARPGDVLPTSRVAEATGLPKSTVRNDVSVLRKVPGAWPYACAYNASGKGKSRSSRVRGG